MSRRIEFSYQGDELGLFGSARNWKRYLRDLIRPHVRGSALEVGAGRGTTTAVLRNLTDGPWTCVEPDRDLAEEIPRQVNNLEVRVVVGVVGDLDPSENFDTIIYVDVLEHIEDDRTQLQQARSLLSESGRLIVLAPAHKWLFSPFDHAIGHFRRYTRSTLVELTPPKCRVEACFYVDSVGLFASAGNRLLLRQSMPTGNQIRFWDELIVPCSRFLDPFFFRRVGKSVICVWSTESTSDQATF